MLIKQMREPLNVILVISIVTWQDESLIEFYSGEYVKFWPILQQYSSHKLLPPANEVWGKVIFLHLFVILFTGGMPGPGGGVWLGGLLPGGCLILGGSAPRGVSAPGGVPGPGEGCLLPGGAWWRPPREGQCCVQYASYWNAFLLWEWICKGRISVGMSFGQAQ